MQTLACIARHRREHHVPPTLRELTAALGLASSSVAYAQLAVSQLTRRGLVTHAPGRYRTVRLTAAGKALLVMAFLALRRCDEYAAVVVCTSCQQWEEV